MARRRFEVLDDVTDIDTIAVGRNIRDLSRLRKRYGTGRWRKNEGCRYDSAADGQVRRAELHWYEAHGTGRIEMKRKRYVRES